MWPLANRLKASAVFGTTCAALLLLGACAEVKTFEYREISDIQAGPGLLTGEDGAFTLTID